MATEHQARPLRDFDYLGIRVQQLQATTEMKSIDAVFKKALWILRQSLALSPQSMVITVLGTELNLGETDQFRAIAVRDRKAAAGGTGYRLRLSLEMSRAFRWGCSTTETMSRAFRWGW